jgi:hypothetical protein
MHLASSIAVGGHVRRDLLGIADIGRSFIKTGTDKTPSQRIAGYRS